VTIGDHRPTMTRRMEVTLPVTDREIYIEDLYQMWQAGHEYMPTVGHSYRHARTELWSAENQIDEAFAGTDYGHNVSQVLEPLIKAVKRTADWSLATGEGIERAVAHYRDADGVSAEVIARIDQRLAETPGQDPWDPPWHRPAGGPI
jgi:hypothetical protein